MDRLSQNNLNQFLKEETKFRGKEDIQEFVKRKRKEGQDLPNGKVIFPSHSHLDKTIVSKISLLFSKLDAELYVDWMDKSLPETTNKITADNIKNKIRECNHFLFLATYHGLRSKWCNWEIGIADILKSESRLAILPIQSKSGNWSGYEYLQLYPEMVIENENLDSLSLNDIHVKKTDGESISFEQWLLS
ncbi:MAG: hypothetical protein A2W90_10430 [Bacteroidetes bacterium GWF2_42_66]|nr:MAG: hypothetical protein A2W92_24125 [Bacteroidetes bacterium GWA2_42_15]OFY01493.1 MAG: hypothetical protein A2W89_02085 [Bacteroidetes bacterium GWE2_42_39]OFY43326.1 MAG: hypothetical protein A2W90_10430 [Bacteroidetes bacterium GWF2_42_66]HBL77491.1 hypothetical protein [Prolixibacteraceae bacterium]HCR91284.1 hypothetical protein [Prolixibacteraceae bacterium]